MQQQDGLFKWQELDRCWGGAGVRGVGIYISLMADFQRTAYVKRAKTSTITAKISFT